MPDVEVVVPWRAGCPHREAAWSWVERELARHGWPVTLAEAPAGEWCKAAAVTPAIAASRAPIIVVSDADVWTPGITRAVERVRAGTAWAVPHTMINRLTPEATRDALAGTLTIAPGVPTAERPYRGVLGGGVIVLERDLALDVPLDPRFTGWGQEDTSWAAALGTLAGAPWRGLAPLFHFWHPPQPRMSRKHGSRAGRALGHRYRRARHDRAAMRALIEEARCASPT